MTKAEHIMEKLAYIGDAKAAKNMGMSQAGYDKLFTSRASSKARVTRETKATGKKLKEEVDTRPKNPSTGKYLAKDSDKWYKKTWGQQDKLVMPEIHATSGERNKAFAEGMK